jgi:hypothetical protein
MLLGVIKLTENRKELNMGLAQKAMLVDLHVSRWSGFKTDAKASKQLVKDANAEDGSATVSKRIVPRETFSDIITAYNALDKHMKKHTLPWSDNGQRIMTRNMFELFMQGYGELERNFNAAVKEFIEVKYPPVRDKASFRLGDLFVASDYPTVDELREKFRVDLDIDGITEPDDFRVALPDQELNKLKSSLEESINRRLESAMQDVWLRIAALLEHYIEKMDDSEAIFRDSTVNNLVELMNILPGLNVTGDPKLKEIRQRIMGTIGSYQPNDLRKGSDLRAAAAKEAREIKESINEHIKGA